MAGKVISGGINKVRSMSIEDKRIQGKMLCHKIRGKEYGLWDFFLWNNLRANTIEGATDWFAEMKRGF